MNNAYKYTNIWQSQKIDSLSPTSLVGLERQRKTILTLAVEHFLFMIRLDRFLGMFFCASQACRQRSWRSHILQMWWWFCLPFALPNLFTALHSACFLRFTLWLQMFICWMTVGHFVKPLSGQQKLFCSFDLLFILIEADFNEGRGRRELLSSSNLASSLLSDQLLAVTKHSWGLESGST